MGVDEEMEEVMMDARIGLAETPEGPRTACMPRAVVLSDKPMGRFWLCGSCGSGVDRSDAFCRRCGARFLWKPRFGKGARWNEQPGEN